MSTAWVVPSVDQEGMLHRGVNVLLALNRQVLRVYPNSKCVTPILGMCSGQESKCPNTILFHLSHGCLSLTSTGPSGLFLV